MAADIGFSPPLDRTEEAILVCLTSLYKAELDLMESINRLNRVCEAVKLCCHTITTYEINRTRLNLFNQQLDLMNNLRKLLHDLKFSVVKTSEKMGIFARRLFFIFEHQMPASLWRKIFQIFPTH